jgi:hypothetical protein
MRLRVSKRTVVKKLPGNVSHKRECRPNHIIEKKNRSAIVLLNRHGGVIRSIGLIFKGNLHGHTWLLSPRISEGVWPSLTDHKRRLCLHSIQWRHHGRKKQTKHSKRLWSPMALWRFNFNSDDILRLQFSDVAGNLIGDDTHVTLLLIYFLLFICECCCCFFPQSRDGCCAPGKNKIKGGHSRTGRGAVERNYRLSSCILDVCYTYTNYIPAPAKCMYVYHF